ncbi:MAG: DNA mismatch repair endonuclease MutL [Clostridiales bacterium]|nr:DNA mismatch repair endonuclease MutL [Clostridiales bacterium]
MAKINILPSKVYNRIAAGEVVDRPYSVVKELVENAIDAGATEIEIYVEKGGKELIRVVDNGCGIAREDLQSAFLPHATSKIAKAEDLDNILTLGFRGEAVASIASVSRMTITSQVEGAKCYQLSSNGGELGQIVEVAGEKGTDVKVEMLFFNAPVRLKFLKGDKGEETEITNFVSRFILNRSDIAFTYYCDGKKVLQSYGSGMEDAIVSVYGAAVVRECFKIDAERHGVRVRGYIGNQNFYKANKSYQSVFLNGRYIVNATISAAISNAYSSYLMKRQYPFYVLHVTVPTEVVDVNVHPNKSDVRFADNQIIYGSIYRVVSAVLDGQTQALEYIVPDSLPTAEEVKKEEKTTQTITFDFSKITEETPEEKVAKGLEQSEQKAAEQKKNLGFSTLSYEEAKKEIEKALPRYADKKYSGEVPFEEVNKGFTPNSKIKPYIPVEGDYGPPIEHTPNKYGAEKLHKSFPGLYFERNRMILEDPDRAKDSQGETNNGADIDYFAENKRYLESLDKKNQQGRINVSNCVYAGKLFNTYLLYERQNEVFIIDQHAAHERLIFNRLREKMQNRTIAQQPMLVPFTMQLNAFEMGFIRERLADIKAMGFDIGENNENEISVSAIPVDLQRIDLNSFFHDILADINVYRGIKLEDLLKDKLASAACKAAVKGGMDLTAEEIDALFALMDGDMGLKCPHGRPVVVKMTKTELEKMFKRIV